MLAKPLNDFAVFDSHLHIIDKRFALTANEDFLPGEFTCADYRAAMASYSLIGGAVVSGSFQGFDQDYLIAALQELGPGFVGVTQLPADAPDTQILALHQAGVRVKACGFGRVDFAVAPVLKDLYAANRHALMFGTDLPSTRAPRPYRVEDFNLVLEALGEDAARKVLSENGLLFYKNS